MSHRGLRAAVATLAAGAVLAAGCATPGRAPEKPPGERYLRYVCADRQELGVTFQQQGRRALVVAGGWSHLLPAVPAASGAKYSDGRVTLWTKGSTATLEEDGRTTYRDCTPARRK